MDMLFRPVFTRVKTPIIGSSTDHQSNASAEDHEPEEILIMNPRVRTTPRVSSLIGFRPATPPISSPESFPNLRNPENVYYKPSGDQLAEMLKVVMMNQSNMDPVPIEYNSTILHVLEAYHDLRTQLDAKEESLEVLKEGHAKDIMDFEALASEWDQKESDYKREIKKLEVLLSQTENGMESVSIARTTSVIHGTGKASDTIKKGIGTIKSRNSARSGETGFDSSDNASPQKSVNRRSYPQSFKLRDDKDVAASTSFAERRLENRDTMDSCSSEEQFPITSSTLLPRESPPVQKVKVSEQSSVHGIQTLTRSQLEALERQQAQEFGVILESSASGADSSSTSYNSDVPAYRAPPLGLGISGNPCEKPLPKIPVNAEERAKQTTLDKYLGSRQHSYSDPNTITPVQQVTNYDLGFSFRAGDDDELLARRSSDRDRAKRKTVDEQLGYRPSMLNLSTGPSNPTPNSKIDSHQPKLAHAQEKASKPSQLPRTQDNEYGHSRMDSSSSSIVTAVRDNSGRSSTNNNQAGRPRLDRTKERSKEGTGGGSSEAVTAATAAVRAYASSKRTSSESARRAAGSGEIRRAPRGQDDEGNKNTTTNRDSSMTSKDSSVDGSEAEKRRKTSGGGRIVEKP